MPLAFANIYTELATAIQAERNGEVVDLTLVPLAKDGADSIKAIHAVAASGAQQGQWVELP